MQFKNYNVEMVSSLPFYSIPKILIHNDFLKIYLQMQNTIYYYAKQSYFITRK